MWAKNEADISFVRSRTKPIRKETNEKQEKELGISPHKKDKARKVMEHGDEKNREDGWQDVSQEKALADLESIKELIETCYP